MPAELRGSRVTSSLARIRSYDRPARQATGVLVSSDRWAPWALAALFVSGCSGLDPIDRSGWFAYAGGFVVATAVWYLLATLRAIRETCRRSREDGQAGDPPSPAGDIDAGAGISPAPPRVQLSELSQADLIAFQHFGNFGRTK